MPGWPRELRFRALLAALAAGVGGYEVCSTISHKSMVWDIQWHNSSASTLAAQKIPFVNGLWPKEILHYHFSGDVLATILRTLSADAMSAANALHAGHDLMFGLTAATIALLTLGLGASSGWSALLCGFAVILQGPFAFGDMAAANEGYSFHSFIHISYRPHVPLAALMLVGAIGALAVRAAQPWVPPRATLPVLVGTIALLAVTDETSTAVLGLALGAAWLVDPRLIATSYRSGIVALVGIGLVFGGMNLLTAGSLAPGGPISVMTWSKVARMAEVHWGTPIPLSTPSGQRVFLFDALPLLACGLALAIHAFFPRPRSRPRMALAAFALTAIVACLFAVTHLEINHQATEASRFWVAPFFAATVLGVTQIHRTRRGSLTSFLFLLGVAVPALVTARWLRFDLAGMMLNGPLAVTLSDLDCRATVGAHLGDRAEAAYVEPGEWWTVSGCRPIYNWGDVNTDAWPLRMNMVTDPMTQLRRLNDNLDAPSAVIHAFCRVDTPSTDPVCRVALSNRDACSPQGASFVRCPLTADNRASLLAKGH